MAERQRENNLDNEDSGVKIEIHGEDDPAEETPDTKDTDVGKTEQTPEKEPQDKGGAGESGDCRESGSGTSEDEGKTSGDAAAEADPDGKDSGKDDGNGSSGDSGSDSKDAGKGFFGFRNKKDKKDEKIEELTDQVRRQMAEFDNFRKRTDREKATMFDMGKKDVIEKILPVVDSFERGLGDQEESADPFRQGMQKVYKQLAKALEELGVKPIDAVGKPFDPNFHNAVMHCEDESVGENTVVQELQKGYMLNDTVIRHSMVKVAN